MPNRVISLPSEDSPAGQFARRLARLLGPAFRAQYDATLNGATGTNLGAALMGLGDALAAVQATLRQAVSEAFPDTALLLLDEWETAVGLPVRPDLAATVRQARIVAKRRQFRGGTPQGLARMLDAVTTAPVTIVETRAADVTAAPRNVFLAAIVLSLADAADATLTTQLAALVEASKPAHTSYVLTNQVGFFTDDPASLTDLTVLGH